MAKIGKISSIKKAFAKGLFSLESSLSDKGYDRFPGTYSMMLPFKEMSGKYRTGLDPDAGYLKKLSDEVRALEMKRIIETKQRLEEATGLDLGPRAPYYNLAAKGKDGQSIVKVGTVRLYQGDNLFTFEDPIQEITYLWLSVHPQIASSYKAYERGEYTSQTQFYVNNEDIEQDQTYSKKVLVNKAVAELEDMTPEKKKKVARLLGLPVSDNTKESHVYNLLDSWIKQPDIRVGEFKGQNPIALYNKLVGLDGKLLQVKDLVNQALTNSIYRVHKGGRIYEGAIEVAKSKEELAEYLYSDKGQEDFLALEDKLASKKTMVVQ